jgi:peptidoglycan/LPS O-acetylase OafA/YrhL
LSNPDIVALVGKTLSLKVFIGNAFFLQTITVPFYGSNGALWSLANEFWYYLIFPCLLLGFVPGKRSVGVRSVYLVLAIGISIFVGGAITESFLIWLMGVAISLLPQMRSWNSVSRLAIVCLALPFLGMAIVAVTKSMMAPLASDMILGSICSLSLYIILQKGVAAPRPIVASIADFFARSSYTLYLVHQPALVFFAALCVPAKWQPDLKHFLAAALIALVVFAYSQLMFALFERRTDWIRDRLRGLRLPQLNSRLRAVESSLR